MNPFKKLIEYLRSVKSELVKVSWPSQRDTMRYSALVIGISVLTAVAFASLDFGFTKLTDVGLAARAQYIASKATDPNATTTPAAPAPETKPVIDFSDVTPITTPASTTK